MPAITAPPRVPSAIPVALTTHSFRRKSLNSFMLKALSDMGL